MGRRGAVGRWAASPARVAQRGVAIINLLGLLFITPVVTFYLLRDWEKVVAAIDGALPRDNADTIRKLVARSQRRHRGLPAWPGAGLPLRSARIYAIGLSLVGLQFGFVIGLIAGAISFIPFVGTFVGAVMAIGMALVQFPPDWMGVVKVAVGLPGRPGCWKATCCRPSWSATGWACIRSGSCSPCWPAARCSASSAC